jgi:D-glycero-alpha-D-manno-heptose-7-phosphate kinase
MSTIKASAPVRIDLAGGWSDVTHYTNKFSGAVVNIAINKRAHAVLNIDDEGYLKVNYDCDVPVGTGLGTSSAINVALLTCINHSNFSPEKSAELAHKFEILLGGPVGRQDQWASAFGGIQYLQFNEEEVEKLQFEPMPSAIQWLEKHLIIAHSRIPHKSGEVHSPIWEKFNQNDTQIIEAISKLKLLADDMANALESDNRTAISEILNNVTNTTDKLSTSINDPVRDMCDSLMKNNTITAWKVMGAGGGGAVALLSKSDKINETKKACEIAGWMVIEWSVDNQGVLIEK